MMRVSGATSKLVLFSILLEGFLISVIGALLGLFLGHVLMAMMGQYLTFRYHYEFTGLILNFSELWLVLGTILIGVLSSFYPAIVSYKMDISSTLKKQI